ncbi:MAG: HIT family protein [Gemmobacter sp.]|uniref:HIT family protein n=1 Tax=Gemmobacter sp. TaxID=1898957 RepID=UPI003918E03F
MSCLFCRIAAGELPAHRIHEDAEVLAFLDLHPIRPGHVLVIPRDHHVWFEDMPEPLAARVMAVSQRLARALKATEGVERVAMVFTGIHVPHAHAHLVPMHHLHDISSAAYLANGLDSYSLPPQLAPAEMSAIAERLRKALA